MNNALQLNGDLVDRAHAAASAIADDIQRHIEEHTTDTTERATLRLLGIAGVNEIDVPLVNVVVEHARDLLPAGVVRPFVDLMNQTGKSAQEVAEGVAAGELALVPVPEDRRAAAETRAGELAREGVARIDAVRARRNELVSQTGEPLKPYVYVIVATGNIYEDAAQAKAAARAGADVIAVIRTTAQSLLDYVPLRRDDRGLRRHLRDAGELPPHARRPRRGRRGARPLHPPAATTPAACACPRSPPWARSSAST